MVPTPFLAYTHVKEYPNKLSLPLQTTTISQLTSSTAARSSWLYLHTASPTPNYRLQSLAAGCTYPQQGDLPVVLTARASSLASIRVPTQVPCLAT
ncbi:hypothetical protein DSO57_1038749 [Entomophthora muscae]|uniref:Uncharacterized protein n=1 Tax=Entomophthora muscae TaxID=34485 RepID=A0ACC2SMQ2_9FUNG|nr:hypothetical protein DSO57_1038749 [Entomophthora muscae]